MKPMTVDENVFKKFDFKNEISKMYPIGDTSKESSHLVFAKMVPNTNDVVVVEITEENLQLSYVLDDHVIITNGKEYQLALIDDIIDFESIVVAGPDDMIPTTENELNDDEIEKLVKEVDEEFQVQEDAAIIEEKEELVPSDDKPVEDFIILDDEIERERKLYPVKKKIKPENIQFVKEKHIEDIPIQEPVEVDDEVKEETPKPNRIRLNAPKEKNKIIFEEITEEALKAEKLLRNNTKKTEDVKKPKSIFRKQGENPTLLEMIDDASANALADVIMDDIFGR